MKLLRTLAGCSLLLPGAVGSVSAQTVRIPLTAAAVAAALTAAGLQTGAAQVELPAGLSTAGDAPQLHVLAAELRADGRLQVRLACGQPGVCPPFLATVTPAPAAEGLAGVAALQRRLGGEAPLASNAGMAHLRAGQRATLLLENAHMRITVPVLAIDSGAPGATVRVSSLDRKQTYDGVVLDGGTIRGTLP